jgi:nucleotide-binding universal stress UspA family protein
MDITVYGTNSVNYNKVVNSISDLMKDAGVFVSLKENGNVDEFLSKKISSVPAVEIEGDEIISFSKNEQFVSDLRLVLLKILKKNRFGDLFKIVFPTDFSTYSYDSFEFAKEIAKNQNGVILASHVFTPNIVDINGVVHTLYHNEKACREKLNHFVLEYRKNAGINLKSNPLVSNEFLIGFPASEIVDLATQQKADLIVLSTKTPHNLIKRWLGSTAVEIISRTTVPALLIPPDAELKEFKKIYIALEQPEELDYILTKVDWLRKMQVSEISVVHVNQKLTGKETRFNDMIDKQKEWNLKFQKISHTDTATALIELSQNEDTDLMVVYHKDRRWLDDLLNKSTSKKVIGHMDVPILVVV